MMPQMISNAGKFEIMSFHTVVVAAGHKLTVFSSPTDKPIVKAVYGQGIFAEKAHVAGFDAAVVLAAVFADQSRQTTAAQGGQAFFYAGIKQRQIGQTVGCQNFLRARFA